ncbi:hypothetical protein GGR56DRAFT_349781 [Xylariaceae sp. FL0804]|nr:hypothetical protein GGR56DRAFT_349781 [Xylariaceae sp. FL0804]
MKALIRGLLNSWSQCLEPCCAPVASYPDEKSQSHASHTPFMVIHEQPSYLAPPTTAPMGFTMMEQSPKERAPGKKRGFRWGRFSVRKRLLSSRTSSPSRRPQISAPSNFRHVHSESFRFPEHGGAQRRQRPRSFRPLELSMYLVHRRLSPLLPIFESAPVTPPPRAFTVSSSDDSYAFSHMRSYSSMSFHIPRRPLTSGGSVFDSPHSDDSTPQRPEPARLRAYTRTPPPPPKLDALVERVASAMLERDRLQEQIDDVMERQSIYVSSRPSTAYGLPEMEPMPTIPALPPDAPSFSERLSYDRPRTAPARSLATAAPSLRANSLRNRERRAPPPPLPLQLRPPLRKKKAFRVSTRVSGWLFPGAVEHKRGISLDSLTNEPKPVTGADGFYQIANSQLGGRNSFDSDSTVSDWTVEEEKTMQDITPSPSTTKTMVDSPSFSIASSATARAVPEPATEGPFDSNRGPINPQRTSVGVAF